MTHSFLLIGQSNMAGRGAFSEAPPIENEHLKVLRNGRWQPMFTPVNFDRPFSGRNLAESFADLYQKEHNVTVGLIPCADGGTSLNQWQEGALLYDHAVYQARLAQRTSTIAGVLWHQGEADCTPNLIPVYEEKLSKIFASLRRDLDLYDVPFLCGGLSDFLVHCKNYPELVNYEGINNALKQLCKNTPMTGFVSAKGLSANPDFLHFNTLSLLEFGKRYYEVFTTLEDKSKVFLEKDTEDCAVRSSMEAL